MMKMHMIGSDHVCQYVHRISTTGLVKAHQVVLAVSTKFKKKITAVTAMGHMVACRLRLIAFSTSHKIIPALIF
jgi:hypothetical protein